jgi:hypothetical protein
MVIELAAFCSRRIHYSFHINSPLDSIKIFSELQMWNSICLIFTVLYFPMLNFHRPLFPILDQTFLLNILFSNSFALFFLSERGTKFQTQDDRLICRFACGSCSLMQYKPDWLYRGYSAGRTDDSRQGQEIYVLQSVRTGSPFPYLGMRNGIFDMLTRLWARDVGLGSQWSDEFYSSSKPSYWLSTSSLIFNGYRVSFSRYKGAGGWSYQSSVSSA